MAEIKVHNNIIQRELKKTALVKRDSAPLRRIRFSDAALTMTSKQGLKEVGSLTILLYSVQSLGKIL